MRKSFNRVALIAALATALPWTTTIAATNLGLISSTTGWSAATVGGAFDDFYNFTVSPNGGSGFAGTSVSFVSYGALVGTLSVYLGTFALASEVAGNSGMDLSSFISTAVSPNGSITTTVSGSSKLLTALTPYTLRIQGSSQNAAAYTGLVALTPVPEPETYAMLLAGLGMVGMMIRRRQH